MKRFRHSAFTLVEMLVVVGIIGILAALILAAVSRAKLKARQVQCLNNLKQLVHCSTMYTGDSGRPLVSEHPEYPGGNWMGGLLDYYKTAAVRVCPAAPLQEPMPTPSEINKQGTVDTAWVRWTSNKRTMFYGSYGYNGWLYDTKLLRRDQRQFFIDTDAKLQDPSETPVFVDANWVDLWPTPGDHPCNNLYIGRHYLVDGNDMGRCAIPRHGGGNPSSAPRNLSAGQELPGAVNVGLFDGHVEPAKLPKLWSYTWHRDWIQPTSIPDPQP